MGKPDGTEILDVAPENFEGEITPEQQSVLDANAEKPWDEPDVVDEKKKPKEVEETDEDDDPGEADPSEEEIAAKQKAEEEESSNEPDEELTEEEKQKAEEERIANEGSEEEQLRKIAEDEGITVEEAKEAIAKDKALVERHGSDPVKIARALRKEQSEYGKLKNENERLVSYKENTENQRKEFNENQFVSHCEAHRDEFVEKYTQYHPEQSELSEDVLFERAKNELRETIKTQATEKEDKLKVSSEDRRRELLDTIPEEFKEVIPEIKAILKEVDNGHVLTKDFDVMHIAHYARGKKYTPEYVKSLLAEASKIAKEEPKIKEKNTIPAGGRGGKKGKVSTLTSEQKGRAHEIYSNEDWDEAKIFSEYEKHHKGKDFFD